MSQSKEYSIDTRCIHAGREIDESEYGAVTTPIYASATFAHPKVGQSTGFDYTRQSNPTRDVLEKLVASLEGAYDCVATSSGMAAIQQVLELYQDGEILCTDDLYGGTVRIFDLTEQNRDLKFIYVDTLDLDLLESKISEKTRAIYLETPSNPMMKVTDIRACAQIAHRHSLDLIVDNTFLSPYLQNPIALGADLVLHSGTKLLAGHNDTIAGFICSRTQELAERIRYIYKTVGASLSPFDSFFLIRGIKTLGIRVERQQENALAIANWLKEQDFVSQVFYAGLTDHPGYALNASQARGAGSVLSFRVDRPERAVRILEHTKVITYAESLGGVESLITYPMLQTHGDLAPEVREKLGITDTLIRLSVGIESKEDLIADLAQAAQANQ